MTRGTFVCPNTKRRRGVGCSRPRRRAYDDARCQSWTRGIPRLCTRGSVEQRVEVGVDLVADLRLAFFASHVLSGDRDAQHLSARATHLLRGAPLAGVDAELLVVRAVRRAFDVLAPDTCIIMCVSRGAGRNRREGGSKGRAIIMCRPRRGTPARRPKRPAAARAARQATMHVLIVGTIRPHVLSRSVGTARWQHSQKPCHIERNVQTSRLGRCTFGASQGERPGRGRADGRRWARWGDLREETSGSASPPPPGTSTRTSTSTPGRPAWPKAPPPQKTWTRSGLAWPRRPPAGAAPRARPPAPSGRRPRGRRRPWRGRRRPWPWP